MVPRTPAPSGPAAGARSAFGGDSLPGFDDDDRRSLLGAQQLGMQGLLSQVAGGAGVPMPAASVGAPPLAMLPGSRGSSGSDGGIRAPMGSNGSMTPIVGQGVSVMQGPLVAHGGGSSALVLVCVECGEQTTMGKSKAISASNLNHRRPLKEINEISRFGRRTCLRGLRPQQRPTPELQTSSFQSFTSGTSNAPTSSSQCTVITRRIRK